MFGKYFEGLIEYTGIYIVGNQIPDVSMGDILG